MKINLLTVCTGVYPTEYARKLVTRFNQLTELDVTSYCITDRPKEISSIAIPLEPPFKTEGWWNKMFCYSEDLIPKGWNVYLDLDMVLVDNFDKEILYAIEKGKKTSSFKDAISWLENDYNSSFIVFKTGSMSDVYEKWESNYKELETYIGGDQVWTGRYLAQTKQWKDILWLQGKFPSSKQSLKFQLASVKGDNLELPRELPEGIKIIDCNGRPKPDSLHQLSYIKENWHNI